MSSRPAHIAARACLLLATLVLAGARPQCDVRVPRSPCPAPEIVVNPGTCVEIENPCGGDWSRLATLSFIEGGDGMWFEVQRRPTGVTVRICAGESLPYRNARPATFRVVDTAGNVRDTNIDIATVAPFTAYVTAEPETVTALTRVTLTAHPSGGAGNYSYEWWVICQQGGILGDKTDPSVVAFGSCARYWLYVSDSYGGRIRVETMVPTFAGLAVIATPDTIDAGAGSLLRAYVNGEEMVTRSYWRPVLGVDAPNKELTYARPTVTTTYTFHAFTDLGLESTASVVVHVRE